MDDLNLDADGQHRPWATHSHQLRRSRSWPPALSIPDRDIPSPLQRKASEISWAPELSRKLSPDKASAHASFESKGSSSHSSSRSHLSGFSSPSEVSVEQKKHGFRASVSKRWLLTKQILSDKARLAREHYRAYQQHHRQKSDETDRPDLDNLSLQPSKPDMQTPRKDASKKELPKRKEAVLTPPLDTNDTMEPPGQTTTESSPTKGKIINSPHELSEASSFADADDNEVERGRQAVEDSALSGRPIYPRGFSSRGILLVDSRPLLKRKSRTASGRRHCWREPSPAIVPVLEESQTSLVTNLLPIFSLDSSDSPILP